MRASYTPRTWSRLIQNPEDRRDAARAYIEQVGGALHGFWSGFGEYDGYAIFEAPDNVSMAGAVLAIAAGGALASVETTVLMTVEETLEAWRRARALAIGDPGNEGVPGSSPGVGSVELGVGESAGRCYRRMTAGSRISLTP
jgi:uncharacterized protein with GYD domain